MQDKFTDNAALLAVEAIDNNDVEAINQLFEQGMHPDLLLGEGVKKTLGATLAVKLDDPAIFNSYVEHGANLDHYSGAADTNPLHASVLNNDIRGVDRALAAGTNVAKTKVMQGLVNNAAPEGEVLSHVIDGGGWKALDVEKGVHNKVSDRLTQAIANSEEAGNHARVESLSNILEVVESYETMPRIQIDEHLTKAVLFEKDDKGQTPLSHPEPWARWKEVTAQLAENGEAMTHEDLQQDVGNGKTGLQRAAECFVQPEAEIADKATSWARRTQQAAPTSRGSSLA
ncbi:MAG: hypothetical protein MK052_01225 [Alphaproteobacteria bacterium]|nr:hypothetical protein [Alphaproteobacteria bacterium]